MPRRNKTQFDFKYPPAITEGEKHCYAALKEMGFGTGWGAVIDHHNGRSVRFRLDVIEVHPKFAAASVTLVHGVACVRCESIGFADGVHTGRLPDGQTVGVRDVRDVFAAAAGLKLYEPDAA